MTSRKFEQFSWPHEERPTFGLETTQNRVVASVVTVIALPDPSPCNFTTWRRQTSSFSSLSPFGCEPRGGGRFRGKLSKKHEDYNVNEIRVYL